MSDGGREGLKKKPLVFVCVLNFKDGLLSHCDPDSNCSPAIGGGREAGRYRGRIGDGETKKEEEEEERDERRCHGELGESYFLWVFGRGRRARSVRSLVQLINL